MFSAALTLLFAVAVIYLLVVGVRVGFAWFGGTGPGRKAVRDAGLLKTSRIVGRRTASRGWFTAKHNSIAIASNGRRWWQKRSAARAQRPGEGTPAGPTEAPLPPPRRRTRGPEARAAAVIDEAISASPAMEPGPVPADWMALASRVADAEFEDDAAFIAHFRGEGAGLNAYAEAVFARGETLLGTHGLDPSIVRANMAHADQVGECAAGSSATIRQLLVVYGEIMARIAAGDFKLPKRADEWLTGEGV